MATKFLKDNPDYYDLVLRLQSFFDNIVKLELEMRRNPYLDVKDIKSTSIDASEIEKRKKVLDTTYNRYVKQVMKAA